MNIHTLGAMLLAAVFLQACSQEVPLENTIELSGFDGQACVSADGPCISGDRKRPLRVGATLRPGQQFYLCESQNRNQQLGECAVLASAGGVTEWDCEVFTCTCDGMIDCFLMKIQKTGGECWDNDDGTETCCIKDECADP